MDDEFGSDADFVALAQVAERSVQPQPVSRPSPASSSKPSGSGSSSAAAAANSTPTTGASKQKIVQPTPQALPQRNAPSAILVSPRQKGNPILTHIQSLPWEYTDTPADYVLGATTCAFFLSLKYHRLHPEYIYARIRALGPRRYDLRVLLAMVDVDNHEESLRELAKTSLVNNLTLVLAWSAREAARYLEAYKTLERAAPTAIRGQPAATGHAERVVDFVTVPRGINKADAVGLLGAFGSVRAAINAPPEDVAAVQGWGEVKVKRWYGVVREPFKVSRAKGKDGGGERRGNFVSAGRMGMGRENSSIAAAATTTTTTVGDGGAIDESRRRSTEEGSTHAAGDTTSEKAPTTNSVAAATTKAPAWEPGEDEEEEEAILLAATAEAGAEAEATTSQQRNGPSEAPPPSKRPRYEESELGGGIAAALAKLRRE